MKFDLYDMWAAGECDDPEVDEDGNVWTFPYGDCRAFDTPHIRGALRKLRSFRLVKQLIDDAVRDHDPEWSRNDAFEDIQQGLGYALADDGQFEVWEDCQRWFHYLYKDKKWHVVEERKRLRKKS